MLSSIPMWVLDWAGSIPFLISLFFFWFKRESSWHWSNASLLPYFLLFITTEAYMLAGLQVIYLLFGIHAFILWYGENRAKEWAPKIRYITVPFGIIVFAYSVYITEFVGVWEVLQFLITATAIIGSVLLTLRYASAWTVYICSNVFGVIYFTHMELWGLTIVQVLAALISIQGYRLWKRDQDEAKLKAQSVIPMSS